MDRTDAYRARDGTADERRERQRTAYVNSHVNVTLGRGVVGRAE